jgi:ferredoxin-thioredoxin reductase catalytic chain
MAQKPPPSDKNFQKMWKYAEKFAEKSGTFLHPDRSITEAVVLGLAENMDTIGRPLCPCNFYPEKAKEAEHRRWMCACDEMQIFKYCHCLLFVTPEGLPVTEYLPEDHEGRRTYGVIQDPTPDKGRALRDRGEEALARMVDNGAGLTTPIEPAG